MIKTSFKAISRAVTGPALASAALAFYGVVLVTQTVAGIQIV